MTDHVRRQVAGAAAYRALAASTYDAAAHTVELVAATDAPVRMPGWRIGIEGDFLEILDMAPESVDLSQVAAGNAPFLDSHNRYELAARLGAVTSARLEPGRLITQVTFGASEAARAAEAEFAGAVPPKASAGYRVSEYRFERFEGDRVPVYRATRWGFTEVSAVSIAADPNAGARADNGSHPCVIVETRSMQTQDNTAGAPAAAPALGAEPGDGARAAPVQSLVVAQAAPTPGLSLSEGLVFIDQARALGVEAQARAAIEAPGATAAAVQGVILASAAARQAAAPAPAAAGSAGRAGDPDHNTRAGVVEAMTARMLRRAPTDIGRSFMGLRVCDLIAERAGINSRDPNEILQRAMHTTSDFPLLLADAGNKALLAAYEAAPPTYRLLAARRTFNDFKAHKFLRLGDFPDFQDVNEGGEIKSGTIGENKETVTLATKGVIISLSRQAIINDDLGAFGDLASMAGMRASVKENTLFFDLLNLGSQLGPTMSDGYTMFQAANHANYTSSGTAISVTSLGVGRAAMRKQTGINSMKLNLAPKFLLTSPDKETLAQQYTVQVNPTQGSEVNPFSGRLTPVADANLTGNGWYLFADPAQAPNFVYGYLRDAEGPQLMTDTPFGVDGVALRVLHDFAVGGVDYRGGYYNAGA